MNLRRPSGNTTLYKKAKNSRSLFMENVNLAVTRILIKFYIIRFQQYISYLPDSNNFYTFSQYSKNYSLPPTSTYPGVCPISTYRAFHLTHTSKFTSHSMKYKMFKSYVKLKCQ